MGMQENDKLQIFEDQPIRTAWDEEREEWYFSVVDVVGALTESADPTAYWRKLILFLNKTFQIIAVI